MRRMFDNLNELFERGTTRSYPQTAEALRRLRQAIDAELKTQRNQLKPQYMRKKRPLPTGPTRKHYQRWLRLRIENDKLRLKLASHTAAKVGSLLSPEWIMRVFLSSPSSNARGFAKSFREVAGMDSNTVGRDSIGKVRGAWVELYKPIVLKLGGEGVVGAVGAAKTTRA